MKTLMKGLAGIAAMGAIVGMAAGAALAAEDEAAAPSYFSNTELQVLWNDNFKLRSNAPDETSVVFLTLDHFSTWKYGDNYFFR